MVGPRQAVRRKASRRALWAGVILLASHAGASETAVWRPPRICDLNVKAVAPGEIAVTWQGGTPPFAVVRSDADTFATSTEVRIVASDVTARAFRDHIEQGKQYWYQVADLHSPPLIFSIEPEVPHEGDLVTIHGVGFKAKCADNHLILDSRMDAAPVRRCSATAVQFEVPRPAFSGDMTVMTPEGIAVFDSTLEDCEGIPRGPVTWATSRDPR